MEIYGVFGNMFLNLKYKLMDLFNLYINIFYNSCF